MAQILLMDLDLIPLNGKGELAPKDMQNLARLYRRGLRIMALAPQPDRWRPTKRSLDSAFSRQQALFRQLEASGVTLDGVYYLARTLFGRKRQQLRKALEDIIARYGSVEALFLLSSTSDNADMVGQVPTFYFKLAAEGEGGQGEDLSFSRAVSAILDTQTG